MIDGRWLQLEAWRADLTPRSLRRSGAFALSWACAVILVSSLEVAADPLTAWEQSLNVTFGLLIPVLGLATTFSLVRTLTSATQATALATRHGADRRLRFAVAVARSIAFAVTLSVLGLLLSRLYCVGANESVWTRDLVACWGIGCLATTTYISLLLAATRFGLGRFGAGLALGLDLTLGHVTAGWSILAPHQHVMRLIGYPGIFAVSANTSSWILLGVACVGLTFSIAKTPR